MIYDVIIIGAGTTGAAVAYHLYKAGVKNMLSLEMGKVGRGLNELKTVKYISVLNQTENEEHIYSPFISGSNVFDGDGPSCIKMIISLPPYHLLADFADHHGWDGVKVFYIYLKLYNIRIIFRYLNSESKHK